MAIVLIISPGAPVTLQANPDTLDFGSPPINSVTQQTFQLINNTPGQGQDTTVVISNTFIDNPAFTAAGIPATIAAGTFVIVTVTFTAPATVGVVRGTINISSTADNAPTTILMTANVNAGGVGDISISPSSFQFPDTKVGATSAPQTFTITNVGTITVTVHPPTATPPFAMVSPPVTDTVLALGASMTVQVQFTPSGGGLIIAPNGLIVTSTAASSPNNVELRGQAILITPYGYVIGGTENGFATIGNLMRVFNATDFNCEEHAFLTKLMSFYGPGQEARLMRVELQYEDKGVASVAVQVGNEHGETSAQQPNIGTPGAAGVVRNQLADIFISGELLAMVMTPFGPFVMVSYTPMFNEGGDTKKTAP